MTFVRYAAEIIISVILVSILYQALPDPVGAVLGVLVDTKEGSNPAQSHNVAYLWLLLAPVLGYIPESATQFLLVKAVPLLGWIKMTDDRFIETTRTVPLDVIDGIDYFIRFRLEECGITEVQSLATFNPIMLHIETPFGIYQVFDWIAQAQLCCVVGLERFLMFRQFNIRTIFDLERAILGQSLKETDKDKKDDVNPPPGNPPNDPPADQQTDPLDRFDIIYASLLFAPTETLRKVASASQIKLIITKEVEGKMQFAEADVDEYCRWARGILQNSLKDTTKAVEHLMHWISDDLHVRRTRRLWNEISCELGPSALDLYDNETIKGYKTASKTPE